MKGYIKLLGLVALGMTLACSNGNGNNGTGGSGGGGGNGTNISLEGRWYVEITSNNGNKTPYVADISQTDTAFTGTIKFGMLYSKNFNGTIINGSLNFASSDDTLHFEGRAITEDSVCGTWFNKFTQDSGTWYAIRPVSNYSWNGNFEGELYNVNIPNVDTTIVSSGEWKAKVIKGQHQDTVFVAGEMLTYYGSDTLSLNNPFGGWIHNDTLYVDFGCTAFGSNGEFMFSGTVSGDSVSGSWGITPVTGMNPSGKGTFTGYVGN